MKKIILKESQVKLIIDSLIDETINEQNESGRVFWSMCSLDMVEEDNEFYIIDERNNNLIPMPKLSQIKGFVGRGGVIFNEDDYDTLYSLQLGERIQRYCRPRAERPGAPGVQYISVVVHDDVKYDRPMWVFLISTTTGAGDIINSENLQNLKEKIGTEIQVGQTRTKNFVFSIIPALQANPNKPRETPPTPPETKPIMLDLTSPFKFDSIEFVEGSDSQQKLDEFIKQINSVYKDKTIGPIQVRATSSIDGDPDQQLEKQGNITRREYDLRLSQRRADHIADILTKGTGIRFVGRGTGQTTEFNGVGWTSGNPTTPDQTAQNRRLIVTMPKITVPK